MEGRRNKEEKKEERGKEKLEMKGKRTKVE